MSYKRAPCPRCCRRFHPKHRLCPTCWKELSDAGNGGLFAVLALARPLPDRAPYRVPIRTGSVLRWFRVERLRWPDDDIWIARQTWPPDCVSVEQIMRWTQRREWWLTHESRGYGLSRAEAARECLWAIQHGAWWSGLPRRLAKRERFRGEA